MSDNLTMHILSLNNEIISWNYLSLNNEQSPEKLSQEQFVTVRVVKISMTETIWHLRKALLKGKFKSDSEEQSPGHISQEQSIKIKVPIYPKFWAAKNWQKQ